MWVDRPGPPTRFEWLLFVSEATLVVPKHVLMVSRVVETILHVVEYSKVWGVRTPFLIWGIRTLGWVWRKSEFSCFESFLLGEPSPEVPNAETSNPKWNEQWNQHWKPWKQHRNQHWNQLIQLYVTTLILARFRVRFYSYGKISKRYGE